MKIGDGPDFAVGANMRRTPESEITHLKRELTTLKKTLGTLISWLPQSAAAPIRPDEAVQLLEMLEK